MADMNGERRGRCVAHHFNAVCGDGGGVCRGPRPATSFGPQHELPPARLVIHRTDLLNDKGTLIVRWRSDILAHLCPRLHWLWVTVEPHITGTRQRGGCSSGGSSLRPCTPSFGLGTTKP